jgi:hypothetical protein
MPIVKEFEEGKHYYLDGNRVIFTAFYLLERGFCCGSKCRHCPFDPPHNQGIEEIKKEFCHLKKST